MKSSRLSLSKVRAIKQREKIHRSRRKTLNFSSLYGVNLFNRGSWSKNKLTLDSDLHSFKNTPIRTGKIRNVRSIH